MTTTWPHKLYCHDCRDWTSNPERDGPAVVGSTFSCGACGSDILCDECGQPWTATHDAQHLPRGGTCTYPACSAPIPPDDREALGQRRCNSHVVIRRPGRLPY